MNKSNSYALHYRVAQTSFRLLWFRLPIYQSYPHDDPVRQHICGLSTLLGLVFRFPNELRLDLFGAFNLQISEQKKVYCRGSDGALPRGDGIDILRSHLPVDDTLGHCLFEHSTTPELRYTFISGDRMDAL